MTDGLLLLHAWPVDARMWEPQLAALPDGLAVAAPDLPGFGGSEPAGDVLTMGAAAERALEALGERGIDRAVVCGLSMGGYVAFELWRRARDRVIGFVLANTRAVADPPEAAAARRALAERLRSEGNVLATEPPALLSDRASEDLRSRVRVIICCWASWSKSRRMVACETSSRPAASSTLTRPLSASSSSRAFHRAYRSTRALCCTFRDKSVHISARNLTKQRVCLLEHAPVVADAQTFHAE